jgi:hypothetical protein
MFTRPIVAAGVAGMAAVALAVAGPAAASLAATAGTPASAFHPHAQAPLPTVTGPIAGALPDGTAGGVAPVTASVLSAAGYQQKEFFVSGSANAYNFVGTPGSDGKWTVSVAAGSAATYKTRIEVFTPTNPAKFSGHVIAEWDNVTAGQDGLPDLTMSHPNIFRDGDVYVGVSAQFVGVDSAALSNPSRYGSLTHPGDSYSYDIFSQVGAVLRSDAAQITPGLRPRDIIAAGESQSAFRMTTYVDAFAKLFSAYDGYLINSRTAGGSALQEAPASVSVSVNGVPTQESDGNTGLTAQNPPAVVKTRTDLTSPVLTYLTQTDVYSPPDGLLSYGPATQANSSDFRLWEAAGTAHADDCLVNLCGNDHGDVAGASARFTDMQTPPTEFGGIVSCDQPINTGEMGYTLGAAFDQLAKWVATGTPASAPPLFSGQSVGEGATTVPVLDGNGNIVGGVRSPAVDVPVATLTGAVNSPDFCELAGTTTPLTAAQLLALYPTHAAFVAKWAADVNKLVAAGYIAAADATPLITAANNSTVA